MSGQTPSQHNYYREQPRSILATPKIARRPTPKTSLSSRKSKYQPTDFGIQPIQEVKVDIRAKYQDAVPEDYAAKLLAKETKIRYLSEPLDYKFLQCEVPASDFAYQPLYFEELNLERHGTRFRFMQPFVSGTRFVAAVPLLPYKMTLNPPRHHVRNCDPYPSGLPAPWVRERGRFSTLATTNEVLAIATAIMIIP